MPAAKRIEDSLVKRLLTGMTLEQKVGQMTMAERMHVTPEDAREYGLGSVLSGGGSHPGDNAPADWVAMNDAFWSAMMEGDGAPGVPILFGIDAVHGHNNVRGATLFPHNIGFGAADSHDLVAKMARITALEILATGVEWNFAPTLAVVQNPQWGRTYESFGDDPARAARFGEAYVRALQAEGVMGCAKHWVGDGGTLHGIDQGETQLSLDALESTHVAPYLPALKAGVMSVMVSFSSWNGEKCHGHAYLVNELLKGKLGFDGIVVTDWDGIDYLSDDFDAAVASSVNAGLDMFMVPEKWKRFIESLVRQVRSGVVSEERIDDAVVRILRGKQRVGLFELPRPALRALSDAKSFGSAQHRAVAREVVQRSLVLLKHDKERLPLRADQRILVAGRSAHNLGHQCGGWTISWQGGAGNDAVEGTSIWDGIAQRAPGAVLSADLSGADADPTRHDVAVVVIGERPYAEGFGDVLADQSLFEAVGELVNGSMNPLEAYGTSLELAKLHPEDLATLERIAKAGVPAVAILVSGRPMIVERELDACDAFVAAWLPGSEGAGVADVLFGEVPFRGRLPMPWPASLVSGAVDSSYNPLHPAGFGLTIDRERTTKFDNAVTVDYKTGYSK